MSIFRQEGVFQHGGAETKRDYNEVKLWGGGQVLWRKIQLKTFQVSLS